MGSSSAAIALPLMAPDLGVSVGTAAWSISLYVLMLAVTTAVYGRVSDLVGVRLPLVFGITLMTVGALAAALAPTFEVLLVARLFQGAGAAAVPTLGVAALSARYDGSVRGLALGRLAGTAAAISCLGPLVGGVVEHSLGWRAVMALPILGVAVIPFLWHALAGGGTGARLDIIGAVLVAVTSGGLVLLVQSPTSGLAIAVTGALMLLLGAPAGRDAGAPPPARLPAGGGGPQRAGGPLGRRGGVDPRVVVRPADRGPGGARARRLGAVGGRAAARAQRRGRDARPARDRAAARPDRRLVEPGGRRRRRRPDHAPRRARHRARRAGPGGDRRSRWRPSPSGSASPRSPRWSATRCTPTSAGVALGISTLLFLVGGSIGSAVVAGLGEVIGIPGSLAALAVLPAVGLLVLVPDLRRRGDLRSPGAR